MLITFRGGMSDFGFFLTTYELNSVPSNDDSPYHVPSHTNPSRSFTVVFTMPVGSPLSTEYLVAISPVCATATACMRAVMSMMIKCL